MAVAAATAASGSARLEPGTWCGGYAWRVLTLSDPDRGKLSLRPRDTNIAQLASFKPPARIVQTRRSSWFQRRTWRLEVIVDRYRIGSDGEIALVLYDIPTGRYMNAYFANPHCLSAKTRDRRALVAARKVFTSHCPPVKSSWQLLGISAKITGVGYWNPVRTTRGALPNGAELRPIVGFQIVSGCGYP